MSLDLHLLPGAVLRLEPDDEDAGWQLRCDSQRLAAFDLRPRDVSIALGEVDLRVTAGGAWRDLLTLWDPEAGVGHAWLDPKGPLGRQAELSTPDGATLTLRGGVWRTPTLADDAGPIATFVSGGRLSWMQIDLAPRDDLDALAAPLLLSTAHLMLHALTPGASSWVDGA